MPTLAHKRVSCQPRMPISHSSDQFITAGHDCPGRIIGKTDAKDVGGSTTVDGSYRQEPAVVDGISAESRNFHYGCISTDVSYRAPQHKQSATVHDQLVTEYQVFRILDSGASTQRPQDLTNFLHGTYDLELQSSTNHSPIFPISQPSHQQF